MLAKDILTVLISAGALFLTIILNVRSGAKEGTSEITTVIVKLENIQSTVTEIKSDVRGIKDDIKEIDHRLTIVEQSTKSAHKRIDGIEMKSHGDQNSEED